jgi:hypothetical protein
MTDVILLFEYKPLQGEAQKRLWPRHQSHVYYPQDNPQNFYKQHYFIMNPTTSTNGVRQDNQSPIPERESAQNDDGKAKEILDKIAAPEGVKKNPVVKKIEEFGSHEREMTG